MSYLTTLDFLKGLKEYIECEVCEKIKLQSENLTETEYVNPYCCVMHLPNANFTPKNFVVPFISIELDSASDDVDGHTLDIRITVATFGGGYYKNNEELNTIIPDGDGYIDLINCIELIKQALLKNYTIGGNGTINKPIDYGTYDVDAPYPYWYGYLKFTADIPNNEYTIKEESEELDYGI